MGVVTQIVSYYVSNAVATGRITRLTGYSFALFVGLLAIFLPTVLLTILDLNAYGPDYLKHLFLLIPLSEPLWQIRVWFVFIRRFGLPPFSAIRTMWSVDARRIYVAMGARKRDSLFVYVIIFLINASVFYLLWQFWDITAFLYLCMYQIALAMKRILRLSRPPAVLLLTASSADNLPLENLIMRLVRPLHVIVFLRRPLGMPSLTDAYNFRTRSGVAWQDSVTALTEIAPIIVIDTRTRTDSIEFEIATVLSSKATRNKAILLTNNRRVNEFFPSRCVTLRELARHLARRASKSHVEVRVDREIRWYQENLGYWRATTNTTQVDDRLRKPDT